MTNINEPTAKVILDSVAELTQQMRKIQATLQSLVEARTISEQPAGIQEPIADFSQRPKTAVQYDKGEAADAYSHKIR